MRLFVATMLAPHAQSWCDDRIATLLRGHAGVLRRIPAGTAHLTHFFCGDLGNVPLGGVIDTIERTAAATPDFRIQLGRVVTIPPGPRARLISVELLTGASEIMSLSRALSAAARSDWPALPIDAAKSAHVTLLRLKPAAGPRDIRALTSTIANLNASGDVCETTVDHVAVVRSTLTDAGPVYDVLGRVALRGPSGAPS